MLTVLTRLFMLYFQKVLTIRVALFYVRVIALVAQGASNTNSRLGSAATI